MWSLPERLKCQVREHKSPEVHAARFVKALRSSQQLYQYFVCLDENHDRHHPEGLDNPPKDEYANNLYLFVGNDPKITHKKLIANKI